MLFSCSTHTAAHHLPIFSLSSDTLPPLVKLFNQPQSLIYASSLLRWGRVPHAWDYSRRLACWNPVPELHNQQFGTTQRSISKHNGNTLRNPSVSKITLSLSLGVDARAGPGSRYAQMLSFLDTLSNSQVWSRTLFKQSACWNVLSFSKSKLANSPSLTISRFPFSSGQSRRVAPQSGMGRRIPQSSWECPRTQCTGLSCRGPSGQAYIEMFPGELTVWKEVLWWRRMFCKRFNDDTSWRPILIKCN